MGRPRKRPRDDNQQSSVVESSGSLPLPERPLDLQPESLVAGSDLTQDIYGNFVHPGVMSFFDRNLASTPSADVLDQEHPLISEALNSLFPEDMALSSSLAHSPGALVATSDLMVTSEPLVDPLLQMSGPTLDTSNDSLFGAFHNLPTSSATDSTIFSNTLLTDDPMSFEMPCTCLTKTHYALSELQFMTIFSFPAALRPLTAGKRTALELVRCSQCMNEGASAMQNIMLITTLIGVLLERYRKVLVGIEADATRIESENGTIPFRMGDNSPAMQFLHDGTPDCPAGFNIDLAPQEWRYLAKRAIKVEVKGTGARGDNSVVDLVNQLDERQKAWHEDWHAKGLCFRCWRSGGATGKVKPHTLEECAHMHREEGDADAPAREPTCYRATDMLKDMLNWPEW